MKFKCFIQGENIKYKISIDDIEAQERREIQLGTISNDCWNFVRFSHNFEDIPSSVLVFYFAS